MTATLNENSNIQELLKKIWTFVPNSKILVIDDGSSDGTLEFLNEESKLNENLHLITRAKRMGIGNAHLTGLRFAYENGFDKIVTLDADLSHNPGDIIKILEESKSANYVVGTRCKKRGGGSEYKLLRNFISIFANRICRLLIPSYVTEFTTSFRCYDRRAMFIVLDKVVAHNGYAFFILVTDSIFSSKLIMKEVPIFFNKRNSGSSKIPKLQIIYSGYIVIKIMIKRIYS